MASDNLKKIIMETMEINVYKQITTVEPDFFDKDYIITKMVEKPKEQQPTHYPHVRSYDPQIVASSSSEFESGTILNDNRVLDLVRNGFNITFSPKKIRNVFTDLTTLLEGPFDALSMIGVNNKLECNTFYAEAMAFQPNQMGGDTLIDEILHNRLRFTIALMKQEKERSTCVISRGWELLESYN